MQPITNLSEGIGYAGACSQHLYLIQLKPTSLRKTTMSKDTFQNYAPFSRCAVCALKPSRTTPPTGSMRPPDASTTIECQRSGWLVITDQLLLFTYLRGITECSIEVRFVPVSKLSIVHTSCSIHILIWLNLSTSAADWTDIEHVTFSGLAYVNLVKLAISEVLLQTV